MPLEQPFFETGGSEVDAHNRAMSAPIAEVVRELVDLLGATTVAVIGGVGETRAVQRWMADREPQRPHVLRFALQVCLTIASGASRETALAWFHGSNPRLSDQSPMLVLRNRPFYDVAGDVLAAARAFTGRREGGAPHPRSHEESGSGGPLERRGRGDVR